MEFKSFLVTAAAAAATLQASAGVVFDAPGHAAAEGTAVNASGGEPGAAWRIADWRGRDTGISGVFDGSGAAALPPLPAGYYRMTADGSAPDSGGPGILATLAVVERYRPADGADDSPFAIDTALSWIARPGTFVCPWNGGDTFSTVADLLALCGFRHVRERLSWKAVQKEPGAPLDLGRYLENAELFRQRGAAVSGMFHDAPAWAGTAAPRESLPSDLGALHAFCRDAAAAFGDRMEDWEFWNEEDIHFAKEPVWEYVAAMKAAYLGFKAARPDMPVLSGALCQMPDSTRYNDVFFMNDAARYFDVFNYHTYVRLERYRELFAGIRRQMSEGGAAGRPVWFTEFGTNAEGNSTGDGAKPGMKAHSPAQETVHAEFYPKAQLAMMQAGVARTYFFVFPAFNERSGFKDWGVMRRDGTVKPVFSAMATAIRELDGAMLLGSLDTPAGTRAYLFEKAGGIQTAVFWNESGLDTETANVEISPEPDFSRPWTLPLPGPPAAPLRLVDMCGGVSEIAPDASGAVVLPATRFPAYVSGFRGLAAAEAPYGGGCGPAAPEPPAVDASIVLRPVLAGGDFSVSGGKTLAVMTGRTGRAKLQVWNFSDTAKTGTVSVAGAAVSGLPEEPLAIGPYGRAELELVLSPEEGSAPKGDLVFSGSFGGMPASRAVVPAFFAKTFFENCVRVPVGWSDPSRWERNSSADGETVSWDGQEGALRIDSEWKAIGDHWTYPVLGLELPAESLEGAVVVSFEAKSAQDKVENDFKTSKFMLVDEDGTSDVYIDYAPPGTEWEPRFVDIPAGLDLGKVRKIRLGANPLGNRSTIWFRNVEILKAAERPENE